ncbi:hypothetical protein, partial [Shewanella sp.]|uniref:hypothetical protein n=1 Tax=Shewanella sp. TaxID=50422 RepID=UPI00356A8EAE
MASPKVAGNTSAGKPKKILNYLINYKDLWDIYVGFFKSSVPTSYANPDLGMDDDGIRQSRVTGKRQTQSDQFLRKFG